MDIAGLTIGNNHPLVLIAGPCVLESYALNVQVARDIKDICAKYGLGFIFKSSFAKANRSSAGSFSGLEFNEALATLAKIKSEVGVPIITDIHECDHIEAVAEVVDVLQIPALLCRQTKLVQAAAATGRALNIKKGQFMAPTEMVQVVAKARAVAPDARVMVCERGTFFGYHNLVSDMRSLVVMRQTNCPVIFDVGHSVQLPGAGQGVSSGQPWFIPSLARAAVSVGIAGLFVETHPDPAHAKSDGANSLPLAELENLIKQIVKLDQVVKQPDFINDSYGQ